MEVELARQHWRDGLRRIESSPDSARLLEQVDVVTSHGVVVASGIGGADAKVRAAADQRYYFMRVKSGGEWIGYSSPVWVSVV